MGLFDDAGIDADDLKTTVLNGKFPATLVSVTTAMIRTGKKDANDQDIEAPNLVFEYEVKESEFPIRKMFRILVGRKFSDLDDTDDSYNTYSFNDREVRQTEKAFYTAQYKALKLWLMSHGVSEKDVNSIDPADLKGVTGTLSVKTNARGYANAVGFARVGASGTSLPSANSAPAAPVAAPVAAAPATSVSAEPIVNPFAKN